MKLRDLAFALLFAITLFIQLMLFHWQCFHSIIISTLWKSPLDFLLFYLPKVGISLFIASFVFLFKNRWWTVIASSVISIWALSELVYIRANHVPIDFWSVTMIDNMEGFWGSVPLYIEALDWTLFSIPLLLAVAIIYIGKGSRKPLAFTAFIVTGIICNVSACVCIWDKSESEHRAYLSSLESTDAILPPGAEGHHFDFFISPFSTKMERQFYGGSKNYLYDYSVLHGLLFTCKCMIVNGEGEVKLSALSADLFTQQSQVAHPDTKLIICLVESLESWALRPDVMPNLWRLKESNRSYFSPSVISQAKRGTSADGQMIVETGLLPINGGAVCFRYPDNTYPSLSKLYYQGESCALFPHSLDVWNQKKMSPAYGINLKDNYICSDIDTELFSKACDLASKYECVLFITASTHSPFKKVCDKSSLTLPNDMPSYMRDYLRSCNYFDESIGFFVDKILSDTSFANTTIVITGDHTCFQDEKRNQFKKYCERKGFDYAVNMARCPLIIISPKINENIQLNSDIDIYQMDIFPTISKLIGCEGYCWKGFGIDLLDVDNVKDRRFTEKEAFDLSDKIISTNYFYQYKELLHNH